MEETKNNAVLGAYFRLFSTDDGRIVIEDLKRRFERPDVFDPDPILMAGRAKELEVVRYILKRCEKGKEL